MKLLGSNHKLAAAWNRQIAIRLLRRHGTLSRHDISRMTHLQGSTLSYIVRDLQKSDIVKAVGKRQSTQVGQKQVLLQLNPDRGWLLGVSLRPGSANLVLLDAAGVRIDGMQSPIDSSLSLVPAQLREILDRWLKRRGTPAGNMLAVGVGIPGIVDADSGVVLRSIPLQAVNVPLKQLLADAFDVTTIVDHDACFGAFAEAADGAAADVSHFCYFSINTLPLPNGGVQLASYGSALFLQGKIYRGAFYGGGELSDPLVPASTDLTPEEFAALTDPEGGMPPTLIDLAHRVGQSLGPIINLIDVQLVVLAGTARIANRRFVAAVQAAVTDRLIPIPGRAVRVVRSQWEPEAAARGAAVAAFEAVVANGELFTATEPVASQVMTASF